MNINWVQVRCSDIGIHLFCTKQFQDHRWLLYHQIQWHFSIPIVFELQYLLTLLTIPSLICLHHILLVCSYLSGCSFSVSFMESASTWSLSVWVPQDVILVSPVLMLCSLPRWSFRLPWCPTSSSAQETLKPAILTFTIKIVTPWRQIVYLNRKRQSSIVRLYTLIT